METFLLIVRIILISLASIFSIVYLCTALFHKLPIRLFKFPTIEIVALFAISCLFGFGTNSYFGLLAFAPLVLTKIIFRLIIRSVSKKKSSGGKWVEVDWKKIGMKGFNNHVPQQYLSEIEKIPKNATIVMPFAIYRIGAKKLFAKMMNNANQQPVHYTRNQMETSLQMMEKISHSLVNIKPGKTESHNLVFGVIKVARY